MKNPLLLFDSRSLIDFTDIEKVFKHTLSSNFIISKNNTFMKACFNTSVLFLSPSTKYWSFVFFKTLQILCLWEVGSWLSIFSTLRSLGGTAYMKLIYTHTEVRQKHNAWPSAQQFQEEEQKTHTIKVLNILHIRLFFFWGIELDKFTKRPLWDTYICFSWHWTISAPPNFTQARKKTINSLCKHCLNIVTLFLGWTSSGHL